jgi:DNA excision repair protein ERCC-4
VSWRSSFLIIPSQHTHVSNSFGSYPAELTDVYFPDIGHLTQLPIGDDMDDDDENYGLVAPEQLVVVRSYSDDTDSRVLSELQPRFIILFEPNLDFVRRIEVYRAQTPGLAVRVYVLMWHTSAEEDRYLAGLRREKDSFEQLIRERGVS